jgi:lysophospholipase L1-like esterase
MAGVMRTWLVLFSLIAAVGVVAGCKGSSSGTSGPTPIPTSSIRAGLTVLAFGDDFTVGIGTQFCGTSFSGPCTTSPAAPGATQAVNPSGWPQRLAGYLGTFPRWQPFAFVGLGVNGALTGDAPLKEGAGGDVLTNSGQFGSLTSLVSVPRSQNIKLLVTIQSGINDVFDAFYTAQCIANGGTPAGGGGATLAAPCTASGTTLADSGGNVRNGTLYKALSTMLADLNAIAGGPPEAALVVGVPDVGKLPYSVANFSASQQAVLSADSQLANQAIQDAIADAADKAVGYVDWYGYFAANAQYYTAAYYAPDQLHLDDQGYAVLETLVQQTFTTDFPSV